MTGCKQRKGERKKKKNGLTAGGGHECAVRTLPNKDKLFEQCLNSWKQVYNISEHCSNTSNSAKQGQTVRTVLFEHGSNSWKWVYNISEHCSNSVPSHGGLFKHSSNSLKWVYNSVRTAHKAVHDVRNKGVIPCMLQYLKLFKTTRSKV